MLCDIGYVIRGYVPALMQILTNELRDYNMQLLTTKCLNTAVIVWFLFLGKPKMNEAAYCDSSDTQTRGKNAKENAKDDHDFDLLPENPLNVICRLAEQLIGRESMEKEDVERLEKLDAAKENEQRPAPYAQQSFKSKIMRLLPGRGDKTHGGDSDDQGRNDTNTNTNTDKQHEGTPSCKSENKRTCFYVMMTDAEMPRAKERCEEEIAENSGFVLQDTLFNNNNGRHPWNNAQTSKQQKTKNKLKNSNTDRNDTRFFPGHVYVIEKINCGLKAKPRYQLYQSYINHYTLDGHATKNKSFSFSFERAKYLIRGLKHLYSSCAWDERATAFWKKLTHVDCSDLEGYQFSDQSYMCFRSIETTNCVEHLQEFVSTKLYDLVHQAEYTSDNNSNNSKQQKKTQDVVDTLVKEDDEDDDSRLKKMFAKNWLQTTYGDANLYKDRNGKTPVAPLNNGEMIKQLVSLMRQL